MGKKNMLLSHTIIVALMLLYSACSNNESSDDGQNNTVTNEIVGKDGASMILIPAGEFLMGSYEGYDNEKPVHTVYLDDFYMDKYEVTNAQYKRFMEATTHKASYWLNDLKYNAPDQPVVGVNWEDATAYALWAGKRLPTEAEWEKSARGRLEFKLYVWGNDWPPPKGSGNFADETYIDGYNDGYAYTAPVGKFPPNGYGLYDMDGNVEEWCADWYGKDYYANSPKDNPKGPSSGYAKMSRFGSFATCLSDMLRVSYRNGHYPPN
jgi:formylglycine-generating enzyme required for sulfatase activity